jgi:hypothetical protein
MASLTVKRIIAGAIGVLFAVVYGGWTMMLTGGGHGNFIWFIAFLTAGILGLYYPVMAFLAVDLRPLLAKVIFGSLIVFNLIVSLIWIIKWVTESDDGQPTDFQKMWQMGSGWLLFAAFAHFLPTVVFLFVLIRSIFFGSSLSDDDQTVSLNLNEC